VLKAVLHASDEIATPFVRLAFLPASAESLHHALAAQQLHVV
jgi:hypothetical protein